MRKTVVRKKKVTIPLCSVQVKPERGDLCGPRGAGNRPHGRPKVSDADPNK